MTKIILTNKLRVANFSSPHNFYFEDGSVLPAVDSETAIRLVLQPVEVKEKNSGGWTDIRLSYKMTDEVLSELYRYNGDDTVDIVIVPLPVLLAINEGVYFPFGHKFRTTRIIDRINKICSISEFCV